MAKLFASLVIGGAVGWVSNESYKTYKNRGDNKSYDLQKKLATWSKDYIPKEWHKDWDKRHGIYKSGKNSKSNPNKVDENNNVIPSEEIKSTRHLFLIRHGQYFTEGEDDTKHTLTPLGMEQAIATGQRLANLSFPYTKLVVSTMTRAQQTANLIKQELKFEEDKIINTDLLREGAPFPPEPPLSHWKPDSKFIRDGSRIEEAFRTFVHRADPSQLTDSYEIVVCHANVIRYIVCRALQLPPEAWLRISLHHASITWITMRPSGRVSIRTLGDAGFMAPKMLSTS